MTSLGVLLLSLLSLAGSLYACSCGSLSWATCEESSCECYIHVGEGERRLINCTTMIPKCFLMKAEMYRRQHPSPSQTKPPETVLAHIDELYDPDCEPSGLFKPKQCKNTDDCWCVDRSGVRRSDQGDRNLMCEEPVETNLAYVQSTQKDTSESLEPFQLHSAVGGALQEQYDMVQQLVSKIKVKYDADAHLIILDLKSNIGDWTEDVSGLAYYSEKDVKIQTLVNDQVEYEPTVADQKMEMERVLVYYEEGKESTGGITVGILTVTVVVILTIFVGLLILFLIRRQKRGKYEKAQTSEVDEI